MNSVLWTITLLLLNPTFVHAKSSGHEIGNGGGAWVCREPNQTVRWLELVDLYEAQVEFGLTVPKPSIAPKLQHKKAIDGLKQSNPRLLLQLQHFIDTIPATFRWIDNANLQVVDDALFRIRPLETDCTGGKIHYEQLANFTKYGVILINKGLYNLLTDTEKAALELHEEIYALARDRFYDQDSSRTRRIVGALFAEIPLEERKEIIRQALEESEQEPPLPCTTKKMIEFEGENISPFSNGLALFEKKDATFKSDYYFVNTSGKIILGPFAEAHGFWDGLALVKQGQERKFINSQGQTIINGKDYSAMSSFSGGLALVCKSSFACGYIDTTGKVLIPFDLGISLLSSGFVGDYAVVHKGRKYGIIDRQGRWIIPPQFSSALLHEDNWLIASIEESPNSQFGYFDLKTKTWSIFPRFTDAHAFEQDTAWVHAKNKWGLIDRKGNYLLPLSYTLSGYYRFQNGLVPIKEDQKFWFMDRSGTKVLGPWEEAMGFSEGLGAVKTADGLWGFVDGTGRMAIPAEFTSVGPMNRGFAVVKSSKYGLIDRYGRTIVRPIYDGIKKLSEREQIWSSSHTEGHTKKITLFTMRCGT